MPKPDELHALPTRRRQLVAMRTSEQNRLGSAPRRLQADIQAHIAWLSEHLAALDDDLRHHATRQSGLCPLTAFGRRLVALAAQHAADIATCADQHDREGSFLAEIAFAAARAMPGRTATKANAFFSHHLSGSVPMGELHALMQDF